MPRPNMPWLDKPKPETANEIAIPDKFFNLSKHPDWSVVFEQICAWASMPGVTLNNPDPYAAVARFARQELAQRISIAIDQGNPINKRN